MKNILIIILFSVSAIMLSCSTESPNAYVEQPEHTIVTGIDKSEIMRIVQEVVDSMKNSQYHEGIRSLLQTETTINNNLLRELNLVVQGEGYFDRIQEVFARHGFQKTNWMHMCAQAHILGCLVQGVMRWYPAWVMHNQSECYLFLDVPQWEELGGYAQAGYIAINVGQIRERYKIYADITSELKLPQAVGFYQYVACIMAQEAFHARYDKDLRSTQINHALEEAYSELPSLMIGQDAYGLYRMYDAYMWILYHDQGFDMPGYELLWDTYSDVLREMNGAKTFPSLPIDAILRDPNEFERICRKHFVDLLQGSPKASIENFTKRAQQRFAALGGVFERFTGFGPVFLLFGQVMWLYNANNV